MEKRHLLQQGQVIVVTVNVVKRNDLVFATFETIEHKSFFVNISNKFVFRISFFYMMVMIIVTVAIVMVVVMIVVPMIVMVIIVMGMASASTESTLYQIKRCSSSQCSFLNQHFKIIIFHIFLSGVLGFWGFGVLGFWGFEIGRASCRERV